MSQPRLDHIVFLLPHSVLTSPPKWLTDELTLITGGRHADGLTENKLVIFADGSYLEFIAFVPGVDPEKRKKHRWGQEREGTIVDWAFTLPGAKGLEGGSAADEKGGWEEDFKTVQQNVKKANAGIEYSDPNKGGRKRPDDVVLRWATAGPKVTVEKEGRDAHGLPFWCFDYTPRHLRVPHEKKEYITHPNGATGAAGVAVRVSDNYEERVKATKAVFDALLGESQVSGENQAVASWSLAVPESQQHEETTVRLAKSSESHVAAAGFEIELSLFVKGGKARDIGGDVGGGWDIKIPLVPS